MARLVTHRMVVLAGTTLMMTVLILSMMVHSIVAIDACQLLKTKQQQFQDVNNSIEEVTLMIKALEGLASSKQSNFASETVNEQMVTMMRSNHELVDLKKNLDLHVGALTLMCSSSTGPTTTATTVVAQSATTAPIKVNIMSTNSIPLSTPPTVSVPPSTTTSNTSTKLEDAIIIGDGLANCQEYMKAMTNAPNGLYWIKPDDKNPKYIAYCDQTTSGGGWILVTTRKSPIDPKVATIVKPEFNGDSMSKDKWTVLRENTKELMVKSINNRIAIADISSLKAGNCKGLTTDLTDNLIYHGETSGCTMTGLDYCLLGVEKGRSSQIYAQCKANPWKIYQFQAQAEYLPESNIFVR